MRTYVIVIDSFGMGADPLAGRFGDEGSHTALHASQAVPGPKWEFLGKMGLGNAAELVGPALEGCPAVENPIGWYGVMEKEGPGKDTLTGHWELAGLVTDMDLRIFPPEYPSFPSEFIEELEKIAGCPILGNRAASGTQIIQELGPEAYEKKAIIAYTSADSVLQLAAHEEVVPLEELYRVCREARILCDSYQVGRVIARPFIGNLSQGYTRTPYRKDYSIEKPGSCLIEDVLHRQGWTVTGVGKIQDIFGGDGLDRSFPEKGNTACMAKIKELAGGSALYEKELIFINLVDTDMEYGHRRDAVGYCREVQRISEFLGELYGMMHEGDRLLITADHGCDPTFRGTDHTREYVPLLVAEKGAVVEKDEKSLGVLPSFALCLSYIDNSTGAVEAL